MAADNASSSGGDIPPKKSTKKTQKSAKSQDPEEDEEEGEEEFAVEKIKSHRFEADGTLKLEVKWHGYPDSDNTWEPEENLEHCPVELRTYFSSIGGKPQFSDTKKGTPSSTKVQSKKRKLSQGPVADSATPPASSKSSRPKKSKVDNNGTVLDSFPSKATWDPPKGTWENDVISVDTLERDNDGTLFAYVKWSTGHQTRHNVRVVNQKCPQKMLQFYEAHLQFNFPQQEPIKPVSSEPVDTSMAKVEEFLSDEEDVDIKGVASKADIKSVATAADPKSVTSPGAEVKSVATKLAA